MTVEKFKFRNVSGLFYTQAMFFETAFPSKENVIYTLKRNDHLGYPSLRRLFLEERDPTGYLFAEKHLGGWDHLKKLRELDWFNQHYDNWIDELELKLRAESLNSLLSVASNKEAKNYVEVNKFMLTGGWSPSATNASRKPRGAPTKADIKKAAMELAQTDQTVSSDFLRVVGDTPLN